MNALFIAVAKMKFVITSDRSLEIRDNGSMVSFVDDLDRWSTAWVDRSLHTGCHYWQLQICIRSSTRFRDARYICRAGVTQKGCSLNAEAGSECWWLGISKQDNVFRFSCYKQYGKVEDDYRNWTSFKSTHTIGLCLECDTRRLTVVDCERNAVILSLYNLDVSKPLVPAVDFRGKRVKHASAELLTGDTVTPPNVLRSTL